MSDQAWLQFVPFALVLVMVAPAVWAATTVVKKMGYSRWLAMLWFVPLVNLGLLIWLARTRWPLERDVHALRESVALLQGTHATGAS
jgi:hypothetical protein